MNRPALICLALLAGLVLLVGRAWYSSQGPPTQDQDHTAPVQPRPTPPPQSDSQPEPQPHEVPTPPEASLEVATAMRAINSFRRDNGLAPLQYTAALQTAAQQHAEWMNASGRLKHDRNDRLTHAENIAYGAGPEETVDMWRRSPGHRANMLGPFQSCGLGNAGSWWCLKLARN